MLGSDSHACANRYTYSRGDAYPYPTTHADGDTRTYAHPYAAAHANRRP